MPVDHKEKAFETAIEHHLITSALATPRPSRALRPATSARPDAVHPVRERHAAEDAGEAGKAARAAHRDDVCWTISARPWTRAAAST